MMSEKSDVLEKLQLLRHAVDNRLLKYQQSDCVSNCTADALFQNLILENKGIKHQFLASSDYLMFLEKLLDCNDFQSEFSEVDEVIASCDKEKQNYNSSTTEEVVIDKVKDYDNVRDSCSEVENAFESSLELKKKSIDLAKKLKQCLLLLEESYKTKTQVDDILIEQNTLLQELNAKLCCQPVLSNKLIILNGFKAYLNDDGLNSAINNSKHESFIENEDSCGDIKLISTQADCDILEVFYVNSFFKKSSVEVKVIYDQGILYLGSSRGPIKYVAITNCPVNVDDLITAAVSTNSLATILPLLQHRLTKA